MKLKKYIATLVKMVEDNPELNDLLVVSSADDEGNCFNPVSYVPSIGLYNDREFIDSDSFDDWEITDKANAVCIN